MGGTCRLHLQGRRIRQAKNQNEAGNKQRPADVTYSSETSVDFQCTTRRYILEDRTFQRHYCLAELVMPATSAWCVIIILRSNITT
jgi:hypothetical protein